MRRGTTVALILAGLLTAAAGDAARVKVRMRFDPQAQSGVDSEGRVLLFAPDPLQSGSSHSHFDSSVFPNALMEPTINRDLPFGELDLTPSAMRDYGWPRGSLDIRIQYSDAAGTGFNDATLGAQRKAAIETAVGVWASILGSSVPVNIEVFFADQQCDDDGATLASAGPSFVFSDFVGADPGVWYAGPLAEAISGENLSLEDNSNPDAADIRVRFNSQIDEECLGPDTGFYYGLDDNAPAGRANFVMVALHEIGHGLGFTGFVNLENGAFFRGLPDVHTKLTFDTKKQLHWDEMTRAQRVDSAVRAGELSFDGALTAQAADIFVRGGFVVKVKKPKSLKGVLLAGPASFGPELDEKGVTAKLALVDDGSDKPTFACQPILNTNEVAGKIALIDRGDCLFVVKVKNAQDAGAIGAIIIHNEPGPPPGLGGSDPSIDIPSLRVSMKEGRKLKKQLRK